MNKTYKYIVYNKIQETPDVTTLCLVCPEHSVASFIAGQFITVYFPELHTPEGKAYSISSAPSEHIISITVKAMGEFSHRLCSLNLGDTVTASEPYGYFYTESDTSPLVMIAGGIGIAPFRSMITESLAKYTSRPITLFYSNRTYEDIIFRDYFKYLVQKNTHFTLHDFLTREHEKYSDITNSRITADYVVKTISEYAHTHPEYKNPEFLICGSISFTRDFWRGLKEAGVPEEMIITEAFFSH